MTDARCKRCMERKVGVIDIIKAGHGERYQVLTFFPSSLESLVAVTSSLTMNKLYQMAVYIWGLTGAKWSLIMNAANNGLYKGLKLCNKSIRNVLHQSHHAFLHSRCMDLCHNVIMLFRQCRLLFFKKATHSEKKVILHVFPRLFKSQRCMPKNWILYHQS